MGWIGHVSIARASDLTMTIICMHCQRILDTPAKRHSRQIEDDKQQPLHGISHGLCPECLEKHYPAHCR